jgi:hypothetical protein
MDFWRDRFLRKQRIAILLQSFLNHIIVSKSIKSNAVLLPLFFNHQSCFDAAIFHSPQLSAFS